jgi:hypothetical protein
MAPELTGNISVSLDDTMLKELCRGLIPSYDAARFDVAAVRVYAGKETFITFYLADRDNSSSTIPPGRFPVKKFKVQLDSLSVLYNAITGFNFTVANPAYHIDDMEVTNK